MRSWQKIAAFGVATLFAVPGHASIVTFGDVTPFYFTGAQSESGFTYAVTSGVLYGNTLGNAGGDLEGSVLSGGGVVTFKQDLGGAFTFSGLDYSAFSGAGTGTQTLVVRGYLDGLLVGTERFVLGNTNVYDPKLSNWSSFESSVLAHRNLDSLQISLRGNLSRTNLQTFQALDNVEFGLAVPEASTWTMLLLGFGCAGIALRSGKKRGALPAV